MTDTVEELRRLLADIADTARPEAAQTILQRLAQAERAAAAQSDQQRR